MSELFASLMADDQVGGLLAGAKGEDVSYEWLEVADFQWPQSSGSGFFGRKLGGPYSS